MPTFTTRIYSPRWGHEDTYSFIFENDKLTIDFAPRRAYCTWQENHDPKWTGEPFEHMLRNDSICPPDNVSGLVEYIWKAWRNNELNDAAANAELQELVTWLNTITKEKPKTKFWKQYF